MNEVTKSETEKVKCSRCKVKKSAEHFSEKLSRDGKFKSCDFCRTTHQKWVEKKTGKRVVKPSNDHIVRQILALLKMIS